MYSSTSRWSLAEAGVDLRERVGEAVLPVAQVALARVVRAVGQPDLEVAAAGDVHDVDALERGGAIALARIRSSTWRQAAELVVVVLERVRVDRAEPDAEVVGVRAQLVEVVDPVPRDVQRDRRGQAGEAVDLGGVGELLLDGARRARLC